MFRCIIYALIALICWGPPPVRRQEPSAWMEGCGSCRTWAEQLGPHSFAQELLKHFFSIVVNVIQCCEMMFLETGAVLLLRALKMQRNYFMGWNLYRGSFLHPGCHSLCAGQPGEAQRLWRLQPCRFVLRASRGTLPAHAPVSLPGAGLRGSPTRSPRCLLHVGFWVF